MAIVFGTLLVLALALVCFMFGVLAVEASREHGKHWLVFAGALAGVVSGAVLGVLVWMSADVEGVRDPMVWAWSASVVGFIIAQIPAVHALLTTKLNAEAMIERAPGVSQYALKVFDWLDSNSNDLVVEGELERALDEGGDKEMIAYILCHISTIGHVIDKKTSTILVPVYNSVTKTSTFVPINQTHYTYGISRDDLETYEGRLRTYYRNWL